MQAESPYVIVGGGMAARAAIQGLRQVDPDGSIRVFSREVFLPYDRPALSKKLWMTDKRLESIWDPEPPRVTWHLGRGVQALDLAGHLVTDADGQVFPYRKLLLATGGDPIHLPFEAPGVLYFRGVDDYLKLWRASRKGRRFFVIGGGFIGAELAAALAHQGKDVVMAFPEAGILERVLPADLSRWLTDYYREQGVIIRTRAQVTAVRTESRTFPVTLDDGSTEIADLVVAGIGIRPNIELAEKAGLQIIGGGIAVDASSQTSDPDVYAAGDAATILALGRHIRVEHEDNAVTRGRIAGRNMAGDAAATDELPFFYSDLFDLGFEAVGELDGRLKTVEDWVTPYREGVVYYLRDDVVVGVLNWNVWDGVQKARDLIGRAQRVTDPRDLLGRIQNG